MAYSRAQIVGANYSYQGPIPGTTDSFDPLAAFSWKAAFYVEDPGFVPPADGDPVSAWKVSGATRSEGAYLSGGLVLPGTAGNYASVPDEAALDITGDIDIRVKCALDDWSAGPNVIIGKLASNTGYQFQVNDTSGTLRFRWGNGAATTNVDSTVGNGITDGETSWVRATLDVDNGASGYDVKFYKSTDGESWTQIGATVTGGSTTSIAANGGALAVGAIQTGASLNQTGTFYEAQVYDGIAGTKVLDVDFDRTDTNAFTCSTGQTVTVHNSLDANQATGSKQPAYRASVAALNDRPAIQGDGTDDFLQTAAWSSGLTQPVSVIAIGAISATDTMVDGDDTTNRSMILRSGGQWAIHAGTLVKNGTADDNPHLFVGYFAGASSTLDVDGAQVVAGAANTGAPDGLTLLATAALASYNSGHVAFVGVFDGDITAEANWAAFTAWVADHYGLTIA